MINWIILGVFILLAFLLFRVEHLGKRIKIVILVLIGLLIYFSIMNLFVTEEVDLTSPRGIANAVYLYFGWMGRAVSNLWDVGAETVSMVGNAIKFNMTETDDGRR
jgi:hypothetical protein